ncbi:putative signal transducing protein [Aidingimonas halophila]|uniref:Putative signal transducing protein n=1 Tax=Aidingimonas halophila TaxID=574349 RepID=A0A1H2VMX8_9GAMM|nr:DUF2007 domain-containing protein [Aidingimonas halophila]GHC24565.1 hypothetical protein GCM10008094_14560 [Aidingimonas halophila]SDW69646.1 Putative signal transducing protein [Aidingimonas halophila]
MADRIRVFAHSNTLLVSHVCNLLNATGIPAELGNMTLGGGAGELPLGECEPEVRVASHNAERAAELIQETLNERHVTATTWTCEHCGESLEGVFTRCWRCGTLRSD